jgi:hypothetical protein
MSNTNTKNEFHGYESKFDYAVAFLVRILDGQNVIDNAEADEIISSYTRMLNDGIDSLDKTEIDDMCSDIASKWNKNEES